MFRILLSALLGVMLTVAPALAGSYRIQKLADDVYAAIARDGATSNAFFVVGKSYVLAGGAHLSARNAADLLAAVAKVSDLPLRYFILPHHHRGYTSVDFDLPTGCEALMSVQTWQALGSEARKIDFPVMFFKEGLTLKPDGDRTIILTNLGRGHAEGDTIVYLPESRILFTSDLVYARNVGYLGDGHMSDWVLDLEFMSRLDVKTVIPGFGPPQGKEVIDEFRDYLKAFLSEVLRHLEQGDSLETTKRTFRLERYRHWQGYRRFTPINIERAYRDLQQTVLNAD